MIRGLADGAYMRRRREEEEETGEGSDVSCCCCWCCRYSAAAWRSSSCHSPFPRSSCLVLITFFELRHSPHSCCGGRCSLKDVCPVSGSFLSLNGCLCLYVCMRVFNYSSIATCMCACNYVGICVGKHTRKICIHIAAIYQPIESK